MAADSIQMEYEVIYIMEMMIFKFGWNVPAATGGNI